MILKMLNWDFLHKKKKKKRIVSQECYIVMEKANLILEYEYYIIPPYENMKKGYNLQNLERKTLSGIVCIVWVLNFKRDLNRWVRIQERDRWEFQKQDCQRVSRINIEINNRGKASGQSSNCIQHGWARVVFRKKEKKEISLTHTTSQQLLNPSS